MASCFSENSPQLFITADGSHSLHFQSVGESYHSVHGAMLEAQHVYIAPCFEAQAKVVKHVNVLEVGFGTGLNAFLTLCKSVEMGVSVDYTAIEAFPLAEDVFTMLNYTEIYNKLFPADYPFDLRKTFLSMHYAAWGVPVEIVPNFRLTKIRAFVQDTELPADTFHCVYYDAFAPQYQPEMWTADGFAKIAMAMCTGAILTT
ncbi:MAG: SAM-dependent methyltransferase, partial [Bacteroidales bacterium]|nr:SAM-dependent methyltransferase [Bacteroidales bacterium]